MRTYYEYWEGRLYRAVVSMVLKNLDQYIAMLQDR